MLRAPEEVVLNGLINAVADKQQILANNLANVRTKGYVRKDIDFNTVMKDLKSAGTGEIDMDKSIRKAIMTDGQQPPTFERELSEMYDNQLKYILLTRINGHIYKHMEEATQAGRAA